MARTFKVRIRKGRVVDPTELPDDVEGWLTISDEHREAGSAMNEINVLAETLDDQELARRAALLTRILERRKQRVIAPVTAAELVRESATRKPPRMAKTATEALVADESVAVRWHLPR